jgi:hypothetical protein
MSDARKTARLRFAAALTLYALWVVALIIMAAVSSSRPPAHKVVEAMAKLAPPFTTAQVATNPWAVQSR